MEDEQGWDQGSVNYIITDHNGKERAGRANCWHKGKWSDNQTASALASQLDKDPKNHYKFRVIT